jgi:hypothetical protein
MDMRLTCSGSKSRADVISEKLRHFVAGREIDESRHLREWEFEANKTPMKDRWRFVAD